VIPPAETKAPEAPAEAKPEEPQAEAQTAALPPPAKATVPDTLTIGFDVGVPDVPGSATADLKGLAARMKTDPALRVQLLAFASDPEKSVSRSRRLSLERAVNVRKQLLSAGIDSTRIEVRALGEQSGDGAPDRVDAITSRR
jgi:outer membrane protein OmpA-like peptidoglycan-associated protein